MAKYIDADTVVSMPFLDDSYGIEKHTVETDTIENLLDRFTKEGCPEPADVAQVRHGRWLPIVSYNNTYKCSECGRLLVDITDGLKMVAKHYPYCHCGAKMEKDNE